MTSIVRPVSYDTAAVRYVAPHEAVQSAVNELALALRSSATIVLPTGQIAGWDTETIVGNGVLTFQGDYAAVSLGAGVASGTAGAGTTSTSIVKPTGAANWTASALPGYLVRITSGPGAGEIRPIRSNTTTAMTIDAIVGLDSTSVFEICLPSVEPTSDVTVDGCLASVVFRGMKISSDIITVENRKITLIGCVLSAGDWMATYDGLIVMRDCVIENTHKLHASKIYRGVEVSRTYLKDGQVRVEICPYVSVQGEAKSCAANALYLAHLGYVSVEMLANSCSVTPFYLDDCRFLEAVGTDKMTGTGNTGYGMSINTSGRYRIIGCTVTGTLGDIDFDGDLISYSDVSSSTYGAAYKHGSTLIAEAGENKAIIPKSQTFLATIECYGRLLTGGFFNMSQVQGLTATGSAYGDALQLTQYVWNSVETVAAGTGVRLPYGAVLPGVFCVVRNAGANALTVYAYTGGTVNGAASVSVAAGARLTLMSSSADGLSWESV